MSFCPNLSDPEVRQQFDAITQRLKDEDFAYGLWDRYEGDLQQIWEEISERELATYRNLNHPDPRINDAIEQYGLDEINDFNNPYVWDFEKKHELIKKWNTLPDGKKVKVYNSYSYAKARKLLAEARQDGLMGTIKQVYSSNKRSKFIVRVAHKIDNRPTGMTSMADNILNSGFTSIETDKDLIKEVTATIGTEGEDTFTVMKNLRALHPEVFERRRDLAEVYDMLSKRERFFKNSTARLVYDFRNLGDYMDYIGGHVFINTSIIYNNPNLEYFIQSFLHEMVHVATAEAFNNPKTKLDENFRQAVNMLYSDTIRNTSGDKGMYGFTDPKEFLAEFLTNKSFAALLKDTYTDVVSAKDNRSIWQKFVDAVLALFGVKKTSPNNVYDILNSHFQNYMSKRESSTIPKFITVGGELIAGTNFTVSGQIAEIADKIDLKNPHSIKDAIKEISSHFFYYDEYQGESHVYKYSETKDKNNLSPLTFISATQEMQNYGYGFDYDLDAVNYEELDEDGKRQYRNIKAAINIGNSVHFTANQIVDETAVRDILNETGYEVDAKAREHLVKIINRIKEQTGSVIMMSEVTIGDPETQVAGTIDLIMIDGKGRVRLYDFKTKTGRWGWSYYKTGYLKKGDPESKRKPSDQTKYRLQLSMYKYILEKYLGIPVFEMGVIMLDPTVIDNQIHGLSLTDSVKGIESGIDTFQKESPERKRILGGDEIKFSEERLADLLYADESSSKFLRKMRRHQKEQSELTELEELAEKARTALMRRYEIVQARYSFTQRKEFEEFIDKITEIDNATDVLIEIVSYARNITNRVLEEQEAVGPEGYTVPLLTRWRDYILAYQSLDELQALILEDTKLFKDPKFIQLLKDTIDDRDRIEMAYKKHGIRLIAKWLTPYYNGVRRKYEEDIRGEYRVQAMKRRKEGKSRQEIRDELGTPEEFYERTIKEEGIDIDKETTELLKKELVVAGRDIGTMSRWLDNMLDTADPVAAAMVDAFGEAEHRSKLEAMLEREEMVKQLRTLEKTIGKGALESEESFYSFMLEYIDGKPSQHLLRPWYSTLLEDEKRMRKKLRKENTKEEAEAMMRQWRKAHLELYEDDFNDALNNFLIEQLKLEDGPITQEYYKKIYDNQFVGRQPISAMAQNGEISEDAAEVVLQWMGANRWRYSKIHSDYINPQWNKWMRKIGVDTTLRMWQQMDAVEKSTHPEAVFFNYINRLAVEADSMLPYSHRLGTRLPGVAKINSERIREGQSARTYFKETAKRNIIVRPEDTHRGDNEKARGAVELTDENGNPKYFLPIHYTAPIEIQNQSFDIAGIYYRYWQASNDYHIKREILPQMEMAKFFVNERSAKKRDARGNIIMRAARTIGVADQGDEASLIRKTKLADQLNDWFEMAVYGRKSLPSSVYNVLGKDVDLSKLIDALTQFTSLNLLGFNLVQGTANVALGEAMQAIDAFAGEHVSTKSLSKATAYYARHMHKFIFQDWGSRDIKSTQSQIIEWFDIMHVDQANDTTFNKKSKVGQFLDTSTLYMVQSAGEHWMQNRFLFAMLIEKRALDRDGNDIGSMLEQYYTDEKGELQLRHDNDGKEEGKLNLKKSKWTERDQYMFKRKVKGLLSRMHGEYSEEGRVAIQRLALGRMAYQFRKFVIPGFKRRWAQKHYIQRLDQFVEGNYVTTGKFLTRMIRDLKTLGWSAMSENWTRLSEHEKANIHRALGELAFFLGAAMLASKVFDIEGDDDIEDSRWNAFMTYQTYRFMTEMAFYINIKETLQILRSPMASLSVIENLGKFLTQLASPGERFERGPWKGQLKLEKRAVNLIPVYRQYYRLRDVEESINFMR